MGDRTLTTDVDEADVGTLMLDLDLLYTSIEDTWLLSTGGDHDPFEWKGYQCRYVAERPGVDWVGYRIFIDDTTLLLMIDGFSTRWYQEPSRAQLMKLMLVI